MEAVRELKKLKIEKLNIPNSNITHIFITLQLHNLITF